MKLRVLFAVAVVLALGALAVWWWPVGTGSSAVHPQPAPTPGSASIPATPHPAKMTPIPATPTPPVRISTGVMPGQPMHRSSPVPAKPKAPVPRVAGTSSAALEDPEEKRQLEEVRFMFNNYHARLGENPVGTNSEIMKAVMGNNRNRLKLGPPHGQGLNENGELVDSWGTPYFFHQLDAKTMEVRSAGADRVLWTSDDLVTK